MLAAQSVIPRGVVATSARAHLHLRLRAPLRWYDRKQYERQKRLLRDVETQANVSFADAVGALRMYAMSDSRRLVSAHVLCPRPEDAVAGSKPIRGEISLPHPVQSSGGSASSGTLLVFATGDHAEEAKKLGAAIVGGKELIEQIEKGELVFDRCLSTKAMFPEVVKIARILGPKGLMPSPGRGTVSDDIASMITSMKSVSKFTADSQGIVTFDIGEIGWSDKKLFENLHSLMKGVVATKPPKMDASKFVEGVVLAGPLLPGLRLPLRPFSDIL